MWLRPASRLDKPSAMRGALLFLILAVTVSSVAAEPRTRKAKRDRDKVEEKVEEKGEKAEKAAAKPAPPPLTAPPASPADAAKATAILERIVEATDSAKRKAAIAELTAIAPLAIEAISAWLHRAHKTDVEARRAVLTEIKASVPDKSGKFSQPARQTGKEQKADDDLDWQAALLKLDPAAASDAVALGEVIADDAAIRALAATQHVAAAQHLFNAAFGDDTMIYRDECGRYLRKMEPASIPALTRESQAKDYDRKRYATWQLERLDRQEPGKALDSAMGDEALTIAILDAFRATHHREAIHAVWKRVDSDAPAVRAAARAAWMDYITGPPPPPAPMAKLNLPGGKKTKKPKPLWLTYRELADNELRKASNELLHTDYPIEDPSLEDTEREKAPVKIDLEDVTKQVFAYFDGERAKREAAQWTLAKQKSESGDLAAATQMTDRMLAENPDRRERAEMAKLYFAWGKQLESKQQWAAAAAAYSKAHGLDPAGAQANDALAAQHFTLGKSLEAEGKDGGPDFRRAVALKPDYAPARTAAVEVARAGRPLWMLYAAGVAALAAALLFGAAILRRRRWS